MVVKSKKQNPKRPPKAKLGLQPKKVVYLFGAGATQAEVSYEGPGNVSVLMSDTDDFGLGISTGVLQRLGPEGDAFKSDKGIDIEKVISLLAGSGIHDHFELAEKMRQHYFEEICERLVGSMTVERPTLAIALLEMHRNRAFRTKVETLSGILTTNHDGLLQAAFKETFGAVDLGFPFISKQLSPSKDKPVPPLLELHGSFTWKFGTPLTVTMLGKSLDYSLDASWIPPTVLKEPKHYPFNKLTALAYEVLSKHCDVLRVIGSSLTQNDWNILSLIFNAQRHNLFLGKTPFIIQLIMPQKDGLAIEQGSAYLKNIMPIRSIKEGEFEPYGEWEKDNPPSGLDLSNPFFYWLKEKINFHQNSKDFGSGPLRSAMAKVAGGIA